MKVTVLKKSPLSRNVICSDKPTSANPIKDTKTAYSVTFSERDEADINGLPWSQRSLGFGSARGK
jgi:hypothetical protein